MGNVDMLVDSHTHLYLDEFGDNKSEVVLRAVDAGVKHMMFPNVDLSTIEPMKRLSMQFPGVIDMAIGLHPTEVKSDWKKSLEVIESELSSGIYKSVGEVGIDLYWDKTYRKEQILAFKEQCMMASRYSLPVIIHCRDGLSEVLEVLESIDVYIRPSAVFHSFGGTAEDVLRIRRTGDFYFGINGIVTFKNSTLKDVVPVIGIDRILIETDSPYLAPVPMRGRRNESAYLIHTASYVADILNMEIGEVGDATTRNYESLFNVKLN